MDTLVFGALVAGVAVVGIALGLALAPRLAAWDEARSGAAAADRDPVAPEDGYDGNGWPPGLGGGVGGDEDGR